MKEEDTGQKFEEDTGPKLLDIDIWTLHKVHTSFKKRVTPFSTGINQFAVDLHSFFKLSSAHREDYSSMEELTDITSNYLLSHSSVRSLTLKNVLVRIIEQ